MGSSGIKQGTLGVKMADKLSTAKLQIGGADAGKLDGDFIIPESATQQQAKNSVKQVGETKGLKDQKPKAVGPKEDSSLKKIEKLKPVSSSNSTLSVEIEAKPDDTSKSNTTKDKGLSKENTKKEMVDESKPEKKSVQLKPKSIDKTRDRVDGKIDEKKKKPDEVAEKPRLKKVKSETTTESPLEKLKRLQNPWSWFILMLMMTLFLSCLTMISLKKGKRLPWKTLSFLGNKTSNPCKNQKRNHLQNGIGYKRKTRKLRVPQRLNWALERKQMVKEKTA